MRDSEEPLKSLQIEKNAVLVCDRATERALARLEEGRAYKASLDEKEYDRKERLAIQEEGCTVDEWARIDRLKPQRFELSGKVRAELDQLYLRIDKLRAKGLHKQYTLPIK